MYKIEKRISPPPRTKYPLRKMKIGDSFLVKTEAEKDSAKACAMYLRKRYDTSFTVTVRKTTNGYRIWRIAPADKIKIF